MKSKARILRKGVPRVALLCVLLFTFITDLRGQPTGRATSVSILDFGNSSFAQLISARFRESFKSQSGFFVLDPELTRAASKGSGYNGSLNMSLSEARDLGAALASDFYFIGDAQSIRRSSSSRPVFYEAYCTIFVISSRSGRLVTWLRPTTDGDKPDDAQQKLLTQLCSAELLDRLRIAIKRAEQDERNERAIVVQDAPLIEEAPDDENVAAANGLRLPKPYRRLRPDYPQTAAVADAEATVDVLVDIGNDGEVGQVEVVRWAGFGLDEATVATVRRLHFFPAMRDGAPIPLRVLLRYNFRRSARPE